MNQKSQKETNAKQEESEIQVESTTAKNSHNDHRELYAKLCKITPNQLSEIIYILEMPNSEQPGSTATHGERVDKLLKWTQTINGKGLNAVSKAFDHVVNPL